MRSYEGAGGQQHFFSRHQIHIFSILLLFVEVDPIGSYGAFNETLIVVKSILRAIFKKKIEFLRLFKKQLHDVKLWSQERSNRGQSTHNRNKQIQWCNFCYTYSKYCPKLLRIFSELFLKKYIVLTTIYKAATWGQTSRSRKVK